MLTVWIFKIAFPNIIGLRLLVCPCMHCLTVKNTKGSTTEHEFYFIAQNRLRFSVFIHSFDYIYNALTLNGRYIVAQK